MANIIRIPVQGQQDGSLAFFDYAYERGWTDGFPVVPPTPDRVKQMLATVDGDSQVVIAILPP